MQTKHLCVLIHIRNNGKVDVVKYSKDFKDRFKVVLFCGSLFLIFVQVCIYYNVMSCLFPAAL